MNEKIALYPGSFDPPTFGHLDLIERAVKIFHRVVVAVAKNDAKSAFFTVDARPLSVQRPQVKPAVIALFTMPVAGKDMIPEIATFALETRQEQQSIETAKVARRVGGVGEQSGAQLPALFRAAPLVMKQRPENIGIGGVHGR